MSSVTVSSKNSASSAKSTSKSSSQSVTTGHKHGEVLVCTWDVWISGTKLGIGKKALINSIEIKETVDGSDTATLQVSDPNFEFIEDNLFIEKNPVKIKCGWSAYSYRVTFKGYISNVDIDFESDGIPKLTITCMDNTWKMDKKPKSKTWKNKTSAQVVKAICKDYGYKCKVEKGYKFTKQKSISQNNQTDIEFIQRLAQDEVHPFTARLIGDTFYYVKKGKMGSPKCTLSYNKGDYDIISFSPQINKEEKEVNKGSTDNKSKTAKSSNTGVQSSGQGKVSSGSKSESAGTTSGSNSGSGSGGGSSVYRNASTHAFSPSNQSSLMAREQLRYSKESAIANR